MLGKGRSIINIAVIVVPEIEIRRIFGVKRGIYSRVARVADRSYRQAFALCRISVVKVAVSDILFCILGRGGERGLDGFEQIRLCGVSLKPLEV